MSGRCCRLLSNIYKFGFLPNFSKHRKMSDSESATSLLEEKKRSHCLEDDTNSKKPRLDVESRVKKKKVVVLLAYSGQGYYGMQRNPETKTIEEDLLNALLKAGLLTEDAFLVPQTVQFQRAARTDKGVSAARQVISLKLPEDASIEKINQYLPEQIRTFAIKRTTKGFNSKSACDARTYMYMLPTFAFAPADVDMLQWKSYRMTAEVLTKANKTLKIFEGTHNFHNFTSKKKPGDPSAQRYIMSFECGDPFLHGESEFVAIKVKGQSFMLHQIRKMVGLTIAVVRGLTNTDTISKAWDVDRFDIPIAPGVGLVLEDVHYDRYNQRYGNDGIHETLDWSPYKESLDDFKQNFIYTTIVETESKEETMKNWLQTLPLHSFGIRKQNQTDLPVGTDVSVGNEVNGDVHTSTEQNNTLGEHIGNDLSISAEMGK